jgi:hypothetical protein
MSGPIEISQRPEEATRTPENSCCWVAETMIVGKSYAARSRRGAPHELARLLASAGIPDQPVIVRSRDLAGHLLYRSLHAMAGFTIEENSGTTPRHVKWRELAPDLCPGNGVGEAQKGGGTAAEVSQALPAAASPCGRAAAFLAPWRQP